MRSASFALVAGLLITGGEVGAQEARDPRVGLALSGGVATVPDALGAQCGRNGGGSGGGLEASGAVIVRPWRWLVVQGDARTVPALAPSGCTLVRYQIDTSYAGSGRRAPLTTSTLRVGLETPRGLPLLRATAGVGSVWGAPTLPITVLGVAAGTRGRYVRFLVEAERLRTRAQAEEVRTDFGHPERRRPIVVHPVWHAVRLGVEVPLVR
jgi:hypothetical protein